MLDPLPHDKIVALKVVISASLALAIMIVDFLWLIRDEIKLVWPKLRVSRIAWLYMFTRYLGMFSQMFNVGFAVRMYVGVYTSPLGCRIWFGYQAAIVQLLLASVELLLMHRLAALFFFNRLIIVILIIFAVCQAVSMVVSAKLSFPSNKYTVTCMMVKGNPGNAFFSATTLTTNVIIFFMTFWRFLRLPAKWTRGGYGWVFFRDSALSLGSIIVIMLFLMLCSLQVIKPTMSGNITYYWLVCALWVSIGRIVVNHEKIPGGDDERGEGETWKGTLQLTSQIEMGQSTLSVDTQRGSSDGCTPTSRTLQSSLSTPMTKASQLSPSSGCPNDGKWFGNRLSSSGNISEPSSTEVSVESSTRRLLPSNASSSDVCSQRTEDRPQSDGDEQMHPSTSSPRPSTSTPPPEERMHTPTPSPQPSASMPPPGEQVHTPTPSLRPSTPKPLPEERVHTPTSSPRPSTPEPPPSEASS